MQRAMAIVRRSLLALGVGAATVASGVHLSGQASRVSRGEWAAPGGDWAMTRYSALTQIDTRNVGQLAGAWSIDLPAGQFLVLDGRNRQVQRMRSSGGQGAGQGGRL